MPRLRASESELLKGYDVEWLEIDAIEIQSPRVRNESKWARKRKAAPLIGLLHSTMRWAENLPREVRPFALMERFPRIANLVAANWKEPVAFCVYLDSLLVDHRGGREGFPADIQEELAKLRTFYYFGECPTRY